MRSRAWMLRLAALMAAGALSVHQLRYLIGWGSDAGAALGAHGHGYLVPLSPVLAGLLVLALAQLIGRAARGAAEPVPGMRRLWPLTTLALVAVYCVQELAEGSDPGALATHGGWVAVPLAGVAGLAIALAMRGAGAATELTGSARRRPWHAPFPQAPRKIALVLSAPRVRSGSACAFAARGPPLALL